MTAKEKIIFLWGFACEFVAEFVAFVTFLSISL